MQDLQTSMQNSNALCYLPNDTHILPWEFDYHLSVTNNQSFLPISEGSKMNTIIFFLLIITDFLNFSGGFMVYRYGSGVSGHFRTSREDIFQAKMLVSSDELLEI